jgi:hypothetical protein
MAVLQNVHEFRILPICQIMELNIEVVFDVGSCLLVCFSESILPAEVETKQHENNKHQAPTNQE